ncbi:MAG: MBL fold metallo-hydrolase [Spirochaetota bacterium]|nr:MAG: MBL fold metallo-hydrolase [Spirochaetota bacterium]
MKITTLIENTKIDDAHELEEEHGVSLFIETNDSKILFDTGKSNRFLKNAQKLGINMNEAEVLFISHGHYDHGGGLGYFFKENDQAKVYLKKEAFDEHYAKIGVFNKKYIGLNRELLGSYRDRFILVDSKIIVGKNIFIIPDITEKYPKPSGNRILYEKSCKKLIPDMFNHELLLVIKEHNGLVVLTGCSHRGILNMVETVEEQFRSIKIKAVLGGFHLMNPITKKMSENEEVVLDIGKKLYENSNLSTIYSGHCTGKEAYILLKEQLKEKLDYFATGRVIQL